MVRLLKLLVLAGIVTIALPTSAETMNVSALIVAYRGLPACINGNADWSLILQLERPRQLRGEFVLTNFSQPCGQTPKMLEASTGLQRYRLFRDEGRDETLEELINCNDKATEDGPTKPCHPIPVWKRLPGTKDATLPFGTRLRAYRDAKLPLVLML